MAEEIFNSLSQTNTEISWMLLRLLMGFIYSLGIMKYDKITAKFLHYVENRIKVTFYDKEIDRIES